MMMSSLTPQQYTVTAWLLGLNLSVLDLLISVAVRVSRFGVQVSLSATPASVVDRQLLCPLPSRTQRLQRSIARTTRLMSVR